MSPADPLNDTLARFHPAAARCLSEVGRRLYFPPGIPAQSAEAKQRGVAINATIGQVTDGRGGALALPALTRWLGDLSAEEATLYAAQGGRSDLRSTWAQHVAEDAPDRPVPASLPVVTSGLTHGLALASVLFAEPGRTVLLPDPSWGNYAAIFSRLQGADLRGWKLLRDERGPDGWLDLDALAAALSRLTGPSLLLLNFPSNPTGYSPTPAEADALVQVVASSPQPLVVITDDAYQGMWWTPETYRHSLFHRLAKLPRDRVLVCKVDGATKELFYFGGRVGFLTFGAEGAAADALEDKTRAAARATVSSVSATAQAALVHALADPDLPGQQIAVRDRLQGRFDALRHALAASSLSSVPFNSGMFALVRVPCDAEKLRRRLLDVGVGVVSIPASPALPDGALRLSFGSIATRDISSLVAAIDQHSRV